MEPLIGGTAREWKRKRGESKWRRRMEILVSFAKGLILGEIESVDCQGFQLSRYAAELAEQHGIDVRLIKMNLDLSPRQRFA